ncbi:hypothetical protein CSOJ01_10271 [Colletotrichum sojae]|uniref:Uncharacterized protein n=1 Tax=Colletotrichum sojae TaxID=2175907 RepID=A0A8H6MPF1_9PEZI|nr:hypothetical protein CSOJ01_10271 [Colletotrichum sojae]
MTDSGARRAGTDWTASGGASTAVDHASLGLGLAPSPRGAPITIPDIPDRGFDCVAADRDDESESTCPASGFSASTRPSVVIRATRPASCDSACSVVRNWGLEHRPGGGGAGANLETAKAHYNTASRPGHYEWSLPPPLPVKRITYLQHLTQSPCAPGSLHGHGFMPLFLVSVPSLEVPSRAILPTSSIR